MAVEQQIACHIKTAHAKLPYRNTKKYSYNYLKQYMKFIYERY